MQCSSRKLRASSARLAHVMKAEMKIPRLLSAKDIRATLQISNPIIKSKYAYFTLVSINDNVPGALLLGWSLKQTNTDYDCIAMVVPDIRRRERYLLRQIFDRVVEVDTMIKPCRTTPETRHLTVEESTAFSRRMTKCNVFKFIEYQKVIFIESNTYILRNIDELFHLEAPAGISSLVEAQNQSKFHGIKLSKEHVAKSLQLSHGIRGHMQLFIPDLSIYHISRSSRCRVREMHFIQPDVQFLTKLFRAQWTHIHSKFASIPWQANIMKKAAYGVCLENFQPWNDDCEEFDDIRRWRLKAMNMCGDIPQIRALFWRRRWFFVLEEESRQKLQSCRATYHPFKIPQQANFLI